MFEKITDHPSESWETTINGISFVFTPFQVDMETRIRVEGCGTSFVMALNDYAHFEIQSPDMVDDSIIELEEELSREIYHHDA